MIPMVVDIRENVVHNIIVCEDGKQAEKVYRETIKEVFPNTTDEEVETSLDDCGYFEIGDGSICLSWGSK